MKVRLKKLYSKFILNFFERGFIFHKIKYFIQINELYKVNDKFDILVSPIVKYKKTYDDYSDCILNVFFYKTSSRDVDDKIFKSIYSLSSLFKCKILNVENESNYIKCELLYRDKSGRLSQSLKMVPNLKDNSKIVLDKHSAWEFKKNAHFLLSGNTGSGKSYLLYYLINNFRAITKLDNIIVCDPKNSDLFNYGNNIGLLNVYVNSVDIFKAIKDLNNIMDSIYSSKSENKIPYFLIIDEYASLKLVSEKKDFEKFEKNLKNIILKGRAANIHIVLAMQRASSQNLDLDVRDNTSVKVGLGNLSSENFKMIFGLNKSDLDIIKKDVGQGYILVDGQDLKDFEVPYLYGL